MRHKIGFNRLSRRTGHRKALKRNMVTSLLLEERITTTQTKALAIRRVAEKMVTRAKEDSVHNRRVIGKDIKDKKALAKLFTEIGPRFKTREGGYTRVLKLGPRFGDAAEMVLLEFVERGDSPKLDAKKGKPDTKKVQQNKSEAKPAGKKTDGNAKTKDGTAKAGKEATSKVAAVTEETMVTPDATVTPEATAAVDSPAVEPDDDAAVTE